MDSKNKTLWAEDQAQIQKLQDFREERLSMKAVQVISEKAQRNPNRKNMEAW